MEPDDIDLDTAVEYIYKAMSNDGNQEGQASCLAYACTWALVSIARSLNKLTRMEET